jgi:hypothetical protein
MAHLRRSPTNTDRGPMRVSETRRAVRPSAIWIRVSARHEGARDPLFTNVFRTWRAWLLPSLGVMDCVP